MKNAIEQYLQKHGFGQFCPKAVLFDMDGVIYNSMPNHARSWHLSMKEQGLDMAEDDAYRYEGMRGVETIKLLARQQWQRELTDDQALQMYQVKSRYFNQCPPAKEMPGIHQLMQQMQDDGLTIGIVTGSAQHTLLDQLEETFARLIKKEYIVTSYDVKHGKPAPEPYQAGMQKTNTQPWETIVVENAPLGIRAAVAAKCFTIAVNTGPLPDSTLLEEGASLLFKSINELCQEWKNLQLCHYEI